MTLIKTRARGLKLDDTFAFTGTVSGAGGITMADQWRITTGFALPQDTSTLVNANWEQVDTDGFANIGSSMSQSSGIWTFPTTGIYLIQWCPQIIQPSQGATRAAGEIYTTTDNSSYDVAADNYQNIYHSNGRAQPVVNFMFDVTNTSTHKCKLHGLCEFAATLHGNSTVNRTYATFLRLGDT
tara:strand:- start:791 stop:1339 length:549 start_codon:yes stop_codon:yes gene_type:complete